MLCHERFYTLTVRLQVCQWRATLHSSFFKKYSCNIVLIRHRLSELFRQKAGTVPEFGVCDVVGLIRERWCYNGGIAGECKCVKNRSQRTLPAFAGRICLPSRIQCVSINPTKSLQGAWIQDEAWVVLYPAKAAPAQTSLYALTHLLSHSLIWFRFLFVFIQLYEIAAPESL